jgi:hypothetical protein
MNLVYAPSILEMMNSCSINFLQVPCLEHDTLQVLELLSISELWTWNFVGAHVNPNLSCWEAWYGYILVEFPYCSSKVKISDDLFQNYKDMFLRGYEIPTKAKYFTW